MTRPAAHSLPEMPPENSVEVTLVSGRKAKIHELNGRHQMLADSCASDGSLMATLYYRAIAALDEMDGHVLAPASNKLALDTIMERLTGRELDDLVRHYNESFNARSEDLKNESNAAA